MREIGVVQEAGADRWSNFARPLPHSIRRPRWPAQLPLTIAVALTVGFVACPRPALAILTCGTQPEILPVSAAEKITGDVTAKADLIVQARERTGLRSFVTAQRRELRQKYPAAEKSMLDSYLLWVTCQTLSNDSNMSAGQQFDEYSNLYRLLSEPIDKAAPAAE